MNTNLIMGLLIQLVTALKEPTPPVSGSVTNLWGANLYQGPLAVWTNRTFTLIGGEIPTKTVTQFTDEAIRALAKSGRICEVLGHRWGLEFVGESATLRCEACPKTRPAGERDVCDGLGHRWYTVVGNRVTWRVCSICGDTQIKTEGDWK